MTKSVRLTEGDGEYYEVGERSMGERTQLLNTKSLGQSVYWDRDQGEETHPTQFHSCDVQMKQLVLHCRFDKNSFCPARTGVFSSLLCLFKLDA